MDRIAVGLSPHSGGFGRAPDALALDVAVGARRWAPSGRPRRARRCWMLSAVRTRLTPPANLSSPDCRARICGPRPASSEQACRPPRSARAGRTIRDAVGQHGRDVAERDLRAGDVAIGNDRAVFVDLRAEEDADRLAGEGADLQPGVLDAMPHRLDRQPMLRIEEAGLARRDAEEAGIERVDAVEEAAAQRVAVVRRLRGERPAFRQLADEVSLGLQVAPEGGEIGRAGKAPAHADHGDGAQEAATGAETRPIWTPLLA